MELRHGPSARHALPRYMCWFYNCGSHALLWLQIWIGMTPPFVRYGGCCARTSCRTTSTRTEGLRIQMLKTLYLKLDPVAQMLKQLVLCCIQPKLSQSRGECRRHMASATQCT